MPNTDEIIQPGLYDYSLTVEFPSTYIPDHTPPAFRNQAAQQVTRKRYASGQFNLTEELPRIALSHHFARKACEDVDLSLVTVTHFDLTPRR